MYVFKLVQYLKHFKGRFGVRVDVFGPNVPDRERVMAGFRRGLGLADEVALGDRVALAPEGVDAIEGEIDSLSPHFMGVLSKDAIYRFIHGFAGETLVGHHVFADGASQEELEGRWASWLERTFEGAGEPGATRGLD
jgi:hypothetical protein